MVQIEYKYKSLITLFANVEHFEAHLWVCIEQSSDYSGFH